MKLLLERVEGIEPSQLAWKANVLPLNYTRRHFQLKIYYFTPVFGKNQARNTKKFKKRRTKHGKNGREFRLNAAGCGTDGSRAETGQKTGRKRT